MVLPGQPQEPMVTGICCGLQGLRCITGSFGLDSESASARFVGTARADGVNRQLPQGVELWTGMANGIGAGDQQGIKIRRIGGVPYSRPHFEKR